MTFSKKKENCCFSEAEINQTGITIHQLKSRNQFVITNFPGNGDVDTKKTRRVKKSLMSINWGRRKNWLILLTFVHHIFQMRIKME